MARRAKKEEKKRESLKCPALSAFPRTYLELDTRFMEPRRSPEISLFKETQTPFEILFLSYVFFSRPLIFIAMQLFIDLSLYSLWWFFHFGVVKFRWMPLRQAYPRGQMYEWEFDSIPGMINSRPSFSSSQSLRKLLGVRRSSFLYFFTFSAPTS